MHADLDRPSTPGPQLASTVGRVLIYAGMKRVDSQTEARVQEKYQLELDDLPRGVVVGSAVIVDSRPVTPADSPQACFAICGEDQQFGWILADPRRIGKPFKPKRQPQPSFFFAY